MEIELKSFTPAEQATFRLRALYEQAGQQAAKQAGQSVNAYIYEAVCARMQQENATSDTPGVVKNLEGDTDPVE